MGEATGSRRLEIINSTLGASGNTNGRAWHIYEIQARDPDTQIDVPYDLRSWQDLRPGIAIFDIERDERDGRVRYFLKPQKSNSANNAQLAQLSERVKIVEQSLDTLRANVANLTHMVQERHTTSAAAPASPPAATSPPDDDEDIPFLWRPVGWDDLKERR